MPLLRMLATCALTTMVVAADPADIPVDVHGFVGFGWFRTWENTYLVADSQQGSTEMWEAAVSVTSRPMDRLRLGVQLFARDLGIYDNGQPALDYAYADWRAEDWLGVQGGRVRIPVGLLQEEIDNDTARTQIFLPWSVYPLRVRDFFLAVDGAKAYGFIPLGGDQSVEYTAYGGVSTVDENGGFAISLARSAYGNINELTSKRTLGGMLHWNGPEGLSVRGSLWNTTGLSVRGKRGNVSTSADIGQYWWTVASLGWEAGDVQLAAEYSRVHYDGTATFTPPGIRVPVGQNQDGGYVSATWTANRWLEFYGAVEASRLQITNEDFGQTRALVGAFAIRPKPNWSLKLEWRELRGQAGYVTTLDNPSGLEQNWRMVALKTTADF